MGNALPYVVHRFFSRLNMSPIKLGCALILFSIHSISLLAQCADDHRSDKKGGILIKDFSIQGTQALASSELARMAGQLTGSCFNDDSEEIGERLRAIFQNRGYFAAEVKSVRFKPLDPLGAPKPVIVEADVTEGMQYKLAEITFLKNHALSSEKLRHEFPLKTGSIFERDKIARGLENIRKLYGTRGFLDATFIPQTEPGSNGTVNLRIDVDEGTQYRMDKLEVLASKEPAARLSAAWALSDGAIYDESYLDRYIAANLDLLPPGFSRRDVALTTDCPNALVHVRLNVDPSEEPSRKEPKSIPCEVPDKESK